MRKWGETAVAEACGVRTGAGLHTHQPCGCGDTSGAKEPPHLALVILLLLRDAWLCRDPCSVAFPENSHSLS